MKMDPVKTKKRKLPTTMPENVQSLESSSGVAEILDAEDSDVCSYILFERIYYGMVLPKLPSRSWAIHCSSAPFKTIVASELGVPRAEVAPLYTKQIVFEPKLNFEVFLVNTRIDLKDKPNVPQSLEEFEQILVHLNEIKVCPGGPPVTEYRNISIECAYKDQTERWRHNLCSLETADEAVCKSCFSLEEILEKHMHRNKVSGNKVSGKNIPYSRKEKRKVGLRTSKRI